MTLHNAIHRRAELRRAIAALSQSRDAATLDQLERGRAWYPQARDIALDVGAGNLERGAGILAALSPQTAWEQNVTNALDIAHYGSLVSSGGYFSLQLAKANAIREGLHPLHVLAGPKETDFYLSIIGEPVRACIDRHMITAAGMASASLTGARYALIAEAVAHVAAKRGEDARDCQAIIWVVQRDQNTPAVDMPF